MQPLTAPYTYQQVRMACSPTAARAANESSRALLYHRHPPVAQCGCERGGTAATHVADGYVTGKSADKERAEFNGIR